MGSCSKLYSRSSGDLQDMPHKRCACMHAAHFEWEISFTQIIHPAFVGSQSRWLSPRKINLVYIRVATQTWRRPSLNTISSTRMIIAAVLHDQAIMGHSIGLC